MQHLQSIPQLFETEPRLLRELRRLFPAEQKVALAVSGGSDSMLLSVAILSFWKENNWNPDQLFFIHCNHKVRPESQQEARFVRSFFAGYQLKISERTEDIKINEESLRERRYAQFLHLMQQEHIQVLLTGHHLTDRIEGTLLNMLRGCGLTGFIGMQVQGEHHLLEQRQVFRPLLSLSKTQIQSLCQAYDIPYVHDSSNDDPKTSKRNLIRTQFLFPLAEQALQTGESNTFFWSRSQIYAHLEELQTAQAFQFLKPIPLNPYRGLTHAYEWAVIPEWKNQLRLSNLLTKLGIYYTRDELRALAHWMQQADDGRFYIGSWQIVIAHQRFYFFPSREAFWEKEIALEKEILAEGIQTFGLFQLEVPAELIGAKLRFPRPGDKFHGKSLSKWAINQKIPLFWRSTLPLAEKEGKIMMVWKPEQLIFSF